MAVFTIAITWGPTHPNQKSGLYTVTTEVVQEYGKADTASARSCMIAFALSTAEHVEALRGQWHQFSEIVMARFAGISLHKITEQEYRGELFFSTSYEATGVGGRKLTLACVEPSCRQRQVAAQVVVTVKPYVEHAQEE